MINLPPSPFLGSAMALAETLPVDVSVYPAAGSRFSIDEESFFYAIDPPPLDTDGLEANDIEQILKALFRSLHD